MTTAAKQAEQVARLFHALSDETRIQILECLRDCEQCVCDLTDMLKSGQSRLSFHLKILKDAGLIKDRKDGRWVYYTLETDAWGEMEDFVRSFRTSRKRGASGCCG